MSYPADNISGWFVKMVESGQFNNPIPYPLFRSTVKKWCKSDDQFDKLAQAVKYELIKHDIHVTPNKYAQRQEQQEVSDPREQAVNQQHNSLILNAHDDNSTFKLIAWLHDIISKANNNNNLKQICFSVDFKEA